MARLFKRRAYSVSVDEARGTFLYRESGRQMHVAGERMADGYAVYSASIRAWENTGGKATTAALIDDSERLRIAMNIRSYLTERGKSVYLA